MKRLRMAIERIGPPVFVFVLARLVLVHAATTTAENGWSAQAWSRWDSAHYLSIASTGYEFFSCARLPGYDPTKFCGNTGWMPGFPLLIRAFTAMGVDPVVAGASIATTFALATLVLLWNTFLGPRLTVSNVLVLLLAGFFPGHVYAHALFPVSMCAFFQVAAMWAHVRSRPFWSGLAGAAAAFSYGSGLFLAGVLGLDILLRDRREPIPEVLRTLFLECGLVLAGFGAALALQWRQVGVWNGYFAVQAKYGYGPTPPWVTVVPHVRALLRGHPLAPNLQTLLVLGLALALLWATARTPRTPTDRVLLLFYWFYWLIPLSIGGNLSLYRAEAVLMPSVPLVKKLPIPLMCILLVVAIAISTRMAVLFFKSVLV